MACILTVTAATISEAAPAAINTHQWILTRYAKSCSHECAMYQAIGEAMTVATITKVKKSLEISNTMFDTVAPSTLRMPISFVRCNTAYAVTANRPRQASNMAKPENVV